MCMEISLMPVFNLLMGSMMRMKLGGAIKTSTEELKYFAENGVPHPRKLEAQQQNQLKAV